MLLYSILLTVYRIYRVIELLTHVLFNRHTTVRHNPLHFLPSRVELFEEAVNDFADYRVQVFDGEWGQVGTLLHISEGVFKIFDILRELLSESILLQR